MIIRASPFIVDFVGEQSLTNEIAIGQRQIAICMIFYSVHVATATCKIIRSNSETPLMIGAMHDSALPQPSAVRKIFSFSEIFYDAGQERLQCFVSADPPAVALRSPAPSFR
jgi:hypothetical protein